VIALAGRDGAPVLNPLAEHLVRFDVPATSVNADAIRRARRVIAVAERMLLLAVAARWPADRTALPGLGAGCQ
jgi:hypothetical protein